MKKFFLLISFIMLFSTTSLFAMGAFPRKQVPVAALSGAYSNQTNVTKNSFNNMELARIKKQEQQEDKKSILDGVFLNVYGNTEKVEIKGYDFIDGKVDNDVYGTIAGLDLAINKNITAQVYLGYMGSKQKYQEYCPDGWGGGEFTNVNISQKAFVFGLGGMWTKESYFVEAGLNVAKNQLELSHETNTDDSETLNYSVSVKGGYDFKVGKNFIIQPNLMLMYLKMDPKDISFYVYDDSPLSRYVNIDSHTDNINLFHIEPAVKAKFDWINGWLPYASVSAAFNNCKVSSTNTEDTESRDVEIDMYYEASIGMEKVFSKLPLSGYVQLTGTTGSKEGVGLDIGAKYSF